MQLAAQPVEAKGLGLCGGPEGVGANLVELGARRLKSIAPPGSPGPLLLRETEDEREHGRGSGRGATCRPHVHVGG